MNLTHRTDVYHRWDSGSTGAIHDPITRQLGPAIHKAFTKSDTHDISSLLHASISLDVNFSTASLRGRTALMAAAACGAKTLVTLLLSRGADPLLADMDGKGSLEYAEEFRSSFNGLAPSRATADVVQALELAVASAVKTKHRPVAESEQDFVYDVYEVLETSTQGSLINTSSTEAFQGPTVLVPEVRIGEDSCELVFEYSEEWSDLADDEDPDSNDERHFGNDYPEEEEEDSDEDNGQNKQDNGQREEDDDFDDAGSDDLAEAMPRYQRKGVGRVFLPFAREDPVLPATRREGGVRAIWGEDAEPEDEQQERLEGMHARSGFRFGDNPAEFDASGLARYGHELSDDEEDVRLFESDTRGLSMNAVAYDSDLDGSDD
jgi:hypothetical protein